MKNENLHPLIAGIFDDLHKVNELIINSEEVEGVVPVPKNVRLKSDSRDRVCIVSPGGKQLMWHDGTHGGIPIADCAGMSDNPQRFLIKNDDFHFAEIEVDLIKPGDIVMILPDSDLIAEIPHADNTGLTLIVKDLGAGVFGTAGWNARNSMIREDVNLSDMIIFKLEKK